MSASAPSAVQVRVIPARDLGVAEIAAWSALQGAEPGLASPFFHPEFTTIVGAARDDVFIGIIEREGRIVGFFPHQRGSDGGGTPVGGTLSDYHGVVLEKGALVDARQLVRACRLAEWRFDHVPAAQVAWQKFRRIETFSPVMDLSGGYEAYAAERLRGIAELRKKRKIEREIGPLRFEVHCTERAQLRQLMGWKSRQYLDSGKKDIFAIPWVAATAERIHAARGEDFAGLLSILHAGGRVVAAHLGIRSRTVWHYWFPTYDPEFGAYSPGMLLLMAMAEVAPTLGIRAIDLGKGRALYKERLANASVPLIEGVVPASPLRAAAMTLRRGAEDWLRRGPLFAPARKVNAALRGIASRGAVRR